jgi:hypothetical protein
MIGVDFGLDPETMLVWPQFAIGAVLDHRYRFEHLDVAPRQCSRCEASPIDRINESGGASVHDWNFRAVNFDDGVVDVKATQGSQQMFGGRTQRTLGIAENGGKFGCGNRAHIGADFAFDRAVPRDTLKDDAAVVVSRMKCERDRQARMHADAGNGDLVA